LEDCLTILHPFMPFVTEEIWQYLKERKPSEALIVGKWPEVQSFDMEIIQDFDKASEVISGIRTIRKEKNIAFKEEISLSVLNSENFSQQFDSLIQKMGNIDEITYVSEKLEGALTFRVKSNEYFVPVGGAIDVAAEIAKLEEELAYNEGFLKSVRGKLNNERFVNNAPENVVALERQKEADAVAKIVTIKASLEGLK